MVLEGEGAINNVRHHRPKDPAVSVVEETNAPVMGASVTFFLPDTGPNAEFGTGARVLAILTDSQGQAMAHGLIPNATADK